jgi:glycerophosphoryl diester phosphodiesterase
MRRIILTVALSFAALTAARADDDVRAAAKNVRQVIAHRGSMSDRPENTLASLKRAIEIKAHASEVDVRMTKDGALVCMHDADVSRTTDGKGKVNELTLADVKKLDAGSWFDKKFKDERVPTLREALAAAKGKIAIMLDLVESGDSYLRKIAAEVTSHGDPKRTVLGIRSVEQAKLMKKLLPDAQRIGLVPTTDSIDAFADAGVSAIRLWPKWLAEKKHVERVRSRKLHLLIGAGTGTKDEVLPLLAHRPEILSADDPAALLRTLAELAKAR